MNEFQYGQQGDFGPLDKAVPASASVMALWNFGREYRALRRFFRWVKSCLVVVLRVVVSVLMRVCLIATDSIMVFPAGTSCNVKGLSAEQNLGRCIDVLCC